MREWYNNGVSESVREKAKVTKRGSESNGTNVSKASLKVGEWELYKFKI